MTRKLSRNYSLIVVVASVAILALLIAAAVRAQVTSAGQKTGQANAALAQTGVSAPAQAERPLAPWTGAGSSPVSRSHTKRHGARPLDEGSLFGPVTVYDLGGADPASYWYTSVAVADVNDDGNPDVVVTNGVICSPGTARG